MFTLLISYSGVYRANSFKLSCLRAVAALRFETSAVQNARFKGKGGHGGAAPTVRSAGLVRDFQPALAFRQLENRDSQRI
jgi:hypothetical protein